MLLSVSSTTQRPVVIITWVGPPIDSLESIGKLPIDSRESIGTNGLRVVRFTCLAHSGLRSGVFQTVSRREANGHPAAVTSPRQHTVVSLGKKQLFCVAAKTWVLDKNSRPDCKTSFF